MFIFRFFKSLSIWCLLSLLFVLGHAPSLKASESKVKKLMRATAYEKDSEKVLYKEHHTLTYGNDHKLLTSHTQYFSPDGKLIAEMKSDYKQSLMMPTYVFEDHRLGAKEGLELRDGKYYIFNEKAGNRAEKVIDEPQGIFSCQGWHYYIVENMSQIENKDLSLNLLFPSKLDYYSFDLQKQSSKGKTLELRLEFSNWFVRLFAPRLDLTYDTEKKKLLSYLGPSNILDQEGEIQYVKVVYE